MHRLVAFFFLSQGSSGDLCERFIPRLGGFGTDTRDTRQNSPGGFVRLHLDGLAQIYSSYN